MNCEHLEYMATAQKISTLNDLGICRQTFPKHLIQYCHWQKNSRALLFPASILAVYHCVIVCLVCFLRHLLQRVTNFFFNWENHTTFSCKYRTWGSMIVLTDPSNFLFQGSKLSLKKRYKLLLKAILLI